MFGFSFLALFAVVLYFAWYGRAKQGLGIAIFLSLLLPKWVMAGYQYKVQFVEELNFDVDLRVSIAFFGLLVLAWRPRTIMPLRPHWIDGIMLAIVSLHVVSDSYHDGFSIGIILRAIGEWCLPYLAGRMIICNIDDVRGLTKIAIITCSILAILSLIECFSATNLLEVIFGERPEDGASRFAKRWGFKRAFGPSMHPIYFGVLQLLLVPWAFYAASGALRRGRSFWQVGTPIACVTGICATLSRGPMLALLPMSYFGLLILKPRWRIALLTIGVILTVVLFIQRDQVLTALEDWNEQDSRRVRRIETEDGKKIVTSANSRIYNWEVYSYPLKRAGWLGWGTTSTFKFPVRVPLGPKHEVTIDESYEFDARKAKRNRDGTLQSTEVIRPVDNVYLLFTLRFGYGAPFLFLALGGVAAGTFGYLGMTQKEGATYYAAMSASMLATMLVMWTVWMPHDYGFVFIMYCGIAAGLHSRLTKRQSRRKEFDKAGDDDVWTV